MIVIDMMVIDYARMRRALKDSGEGCVSEKEVCSGLVGPGCSKERVEKNSLRIRAGALRKEKVSGIAGAGKSVIKWLV